MNVKVHQRRTRGRTVITIRATPQSAKTRTLLARFKREVGAFHRKWKAAAAAAQRAATRKKK